MRMYLTDWEFSHGHDSECPDVEIILIRARDATNLALNMLEVRHKIHIPTVKLLVAPIPVLQFEISQMIQMAISKKGDIYGRPY